ncbi:MAG: glucose-1-phosphate adenylyltransferase [delta proteobacterium ML8_F1]|nr:MAG: glucose-1-phosphate adenylyltransferase [delta proteobacterium ML8_F1]
MINKEVIAMILAGGQGSRLTKLTTNNAKPAVPYGGMYRIIDFTLSNCSNSGIYTVGILTQYQHLLLNSHVGIGEPWDLDRKQGGVKLLPPYMNKEGVRWYSGTANAVYENMTFMDMHSPEYVVILSGDHIYKMDYNRMLDFHKEKGADVTLSVIEVPWEETHRFGILNTLEDGEIYEFDEKPAKAKNNLASMGVYIFNYKVLRKFLREDAADEDSAHDFGRNIIPKIIAAGLRAYAYRFDGYWKDVGTIESYWEANLDLIKEPIGLNLFDDAWKIYSKNYNVPPQYIGPRAIVEDSLINEGSVIFGTIRNSVAFTEVTIEEEAEVVNSVILPKARIGKGARVYNAIVMESSIIEAGTVVGDLGDKNILLVGDEHHLELIED